MWRLGKLFTNSAHLGLGFIKIFLCLVILNKKYLQVLNKFSQAKILIAGDVMLDRYWFSQVNRISPEAPVPVAKIERKEERLGGAANVAANITSLNAKAGLISVIGNDEGGEIIRSLLQVNKITPYLIQDKTHLTTVKLRVISRNQQLIRLDFEDIPSDELLEQKLKHFKSALDDYQILILSDYGKGGLAHISKMIELALKKNLPILIDPKGSDYTRYKNATLMTPNVAELQAVVGVWQNEAELNIKAQNLRKHLNLQAILLTRSEQGMTIFTSDGNFSISALAREVYDVSGAGDTVIASFALAMCSGLNLIEAMEIANTAASIVVGKLGTATVTPAELKKALT